VLEKNPDVSDLFYRVCTNQPYELIDSLEFNIKRFLVVCYFVLESISRIIVSKYLIYKDPNRFGCENTLIHTFINKQQTNFYGDLIEQLNKRGIKTSIVPYVYGVKYKTGIENSPYDRILLPYAYIGLGDIVKAILNGYRFKSLKFPEFNNTDISDYINHERQQDRLSIRFYRDLLIERFVYSWSKKFKIKRFVHTFEGNTWEKVYHYGFMKYMPHVKRIGYQHTIFSEMHLQFFKDPDYDSKYVPDKIITTGEYVTKLFKSHGYKNVVTGGNLRHNLKIERGEPKYVLVTCPINVKDTCELLKRVVTSIDENTEVKIKYHPFMKLDIEFPYNYEVVDDPIEDLLRYAEVLIYKNTSTCILAHANGIPIIYVHSDDSIDYDPLEDHRPIEEYYAPVSDKTYEEFYENV